MAASVSSACSSTDTTVPRSRDRHSYLHTVVCPEVCALTIVSGTHCVKQPRSSVPRAKSCSVRLAF